MSKVLYANMDKRSAIMREMVLNATPETLRHRRENVIDELMSREVLTAEQHRAGREIASIWVGLAKGLSARVQKYDREIRGIDNHDWRPGQIRAYHERYSPWLADAGKIAVKTSTLASMVVLVVVDNFGCTQIAESWSMNPRTVKRLVREGLHMYAEIGGWVDECGRPKTNA